MRVFIMGILPLVFIFLPHSKKLFTNALLGDKIKIQNDRRRHYDNKIRNIR